MKTQRYAVVAERADGSTIAADDLHATEAVALVRDAITLATKLTIMPERDGVDYALVTTPVLPLEDLLVWRQPDDALTQLFRADAQEHTAYRPEAAVLYDGTPESGSLSSLRGRTGLTLSEYNARFDKIVQLFADDQLTRDDASAAMRELTSLHIWR